MVTLFNIATGMGGLGGSSGLVLPDILDAGRIFCGEEPHSFTSGSELLDSSHFYSPMSTQPFGAPSLGFAGLFGPSPAAGSGNVFGVKVVPPPFLNLASSSASRSTNTYFPALDMGAFPEISLGDVGSLGGGGSSTSSTGTTTKTSPSSPNAPTARSLPSDAKAFVEKFNGDGSAANKPIITSRYVKDSKGDETLQLTFTLDKDVEYRNKEGDELIAGIKELAKGHQGELEIIFGEGTVYYKDNVSAADFTKDYLIHTQSSKAATPPPPKSIETKYQKSKSFGINSDDKKHYYVDAGRMDGEESLRLFTNSGFKEEGWIYVEHAADKNGNGEVKRWYEMGTEESEKSVKLNFGPLNALKKEGVNIAWASLYHQHPKENGAASSEYDPPTYDDLDSFLKFAEVAGDTPCDMRVVTARGIYVLSLPNGKNDIASIRAKIGTDSAKFDDETRKERADKPDDPLLQRYADLGFKCRFEEFVEDAEPAQAAVSAGSAQPASQTATVTPQVTVPLAQPAVTTNQPASAPTVANSTGNTDSVTPPEVPDEMP